VLFEDEASFWIDGTLHRTWARIGQQPRVDTYGERKTAHVFGAVNLETADFHYRFADKFNGATFFGFLKQLVASYHGRKIFLVIDNAPAHRLDEEGRAWLNENRSLIELHRLPPYSPEFMPVEGIWKQTRKMATHNKFHASTDERDNALRRTFRKFQRRPTLIQALVARFQ
jgi:transposase